MNAASAATCAACLADLRAARCWHCQAPILSGAARCSACGMLTDREAAAHRAASARWMHRLSTADVAWAAAVLVSGAAFAVAAARAVASERLTLQVATHFTVASGVFVPAALLALVWFAWARRSVSASVLFIAFAGGASVGVAASLLLYFAVPVAGLLVGVLLLLPVVVGAAEEGGKAWATWMLLRRVPATGEREGLAFGIAGGVGFALAENVVYALMALDQGGPARLYTVAWFRCATTLAHAAWSGSLCAALWRQRRVTAQFDMPVLGSFVLVSLLHALWNIGMVLPGHALATRGVVASAILTTAVLLWRWRAAALGR